MSREQGPRIAGMRPTANAASRRRCDIWIQASVAEAAV